MSKRKPRAPREMLERISHTLIGHSMAYAHTPWGEAAFEAYDDVQPMREAVDPALRKARRIQYALPALLATPPATSSAVAGGPVSVATDKGGGAEKPIVPGTSYCMGVDVAGLLINGKKSYKGLVSDDNEEPLSPRDTRAWLVDQLQKGRQVLPMGECDNWDYQTGCKGHAPTPTQESQG